MKRAAAHKPADQLPPATPAMLALGRALGALMAADGDVARPIPHPGYRQNQTDGGLK